MGDAFDAAQQAVTATGSTMTLGTATGGHYCQNCQRATAEVAPLLRLTADGPEVVAAFIWCPCNGQAQLDGTEGE